MIGNIDKALYEIAPDQIEKRRYNPLAGFAIVTAAAVMLAAGIFVEPIASDGELGRWLTMLSLCALAVGAVMVCYWLFGDSVRPYCKGNSKRLLRTELSFDKVDLGRVEAMVSAGDFKSLETLPRSTSSGVIAVIYSSGDDLAVAQVCEYVPHEYRPVSEPHLFRKGEFRTAGFME